VTLFTIGHGRRPIEELIELIGNAGVETLVDVRRFPGSRRNPQFNQGPLAAALNGAGIAYRHAVALGGRRSNEAGAERFPCIRVEAFRNYAARMGVPEWQAALDDCLGAPTPCFMCAETPWTKCHRRFVGELLTARGHDVVHLIRRGETEPHRLLAESDVRDGQLYVCGSLVA
jgi:uncharacterized protein (DUF488 family)